MDVVFPSQVPCIAVVENMCFFEGDDKRYYPFGRGSGAQVLLTLQEFTLVIVSLMFHYFFMADICAL